MSKKIHANFYNDMIKLHFNHNIYHNRLLNTGSVNVDLFQPGRYTLE